MANEGQLRRAIIYFITGFRLMILVTLFLLWGYNQLTDTQLYQLLYAVLPLSAMYVALIAKHIFDNSRYFSPGDSITKDYIKLSYVPPVLFYVTELLLIAFNSSVFDKNIEALYWWVVGIECASGIYAGYFLSGLFTKQPEKVLQSIK